MVVRAGRLRYPETPAGRCSLLFGILNITRDSFSDGGRYLEPVVALEHAAAMIAAGADAIDVGAASSHPDAEHVAPAEEIARLEPVLAGLAARGIPFSVDSCRPDTQRFAIAAGAAWINDILGFPDPSMWPELAASGVGLIAMHQIQASERADRTDARPTVEAIAAFLRARADQLIDAGVARERIWVDPGMGFFLGSAPEASLSVLSGLPELIRLCGQPVLISVSRKSFLRALTGRSATESGPATLSAELFALRHGASAIRTHDPGAVRDGWTIEQALR